MRLLIFLLISFPAYAEYEFEKSKYQENTTCEGFLLHGAVMASGIQK